MAVDLSPDLIEKQQAADAAHARLLEVQERLSVREGSAEKVPTSEWAEEQHAEWQAAWAAWRGAAEEVQAAIAQTENRLAVEMQLKKQSRHPQPEGEAA